MACAGGAPAAAAAPSASNAGAPPAGSREYTNRQWGFRISVPEAWKVSRGFPDTYLANGTWKAWAPQRDRGDAIVALTMPGSNGITDAEIRIGASHDPTSIRDCTKPPSALQQGTLGRARIGGVAFTTFAAADAAMSHYLEVRAYRSVRAGACYAIDLLVYGTNPEVYDPPATPPFTHPDAFRAMRAMLGTFRFLPLSEAPVRSSQKPRQAGRTSGQIRREPRDTAQPDSARHAARTSASTTLR